MIKLVILQKKKLETSDNSFERHYKNVQVPHVGAGIH